MGYIVQVVDGLTCLLDTGNGTITGNLSSTQSYNTALAFVQALARTQDSNGNTTAVSPMFAFSLNLNEAGKLVLLPCKTCVMRRQPSRTSPVQFLLHVSSMTVAGAAPLAAGCAGRRLDRVLFCTGGLLFPERPAECSTELYQWPTLYQWGILIHSDF